MTPLTGNRYIRRPVPTQNNGDI